MIEVDDRFVPAQAAGPDQEIEVIRTGADMTECRKVDNGVTFTVPTHMLLDPLRWTLVRHTRPTPLPGPRLGDLLREVAGLLDEREAKYGPAVESWTRIAQRAGVPVETALRVMLEMKRERDFHSPENPDHLRDEIGYLGILAEVRRLAPPGRIAP